MASVVIIHAADDALPARALAEKLRAARLTPVIEKASGDERQGAIKNSAVTIALWSPRSVADAGAAEDAAFAKGKSKLIHATMQSVVTPEQFRGENAVDLTGWRGEDDFKPWRELAQLVADKAGVQLPPPAPKPPSGFFQPGRVDPAAVAAASKNAARRPAQNQQRSAPASQRASAPQRPQAPRPAAAPSAESGGGGRGLIIGAIIVVVLAIVGGGGFYLWSNSQNSGAASAWEQVDTSDPAALRAFIDGDPGDYRDEATAALATLEERTFEAAMDANTVEALEGFLNDFPDGDNALAARGRIAELQSATPPPPTDPNALPPGETPDPDLVPPGAVAPAPAAPAPEPAPEPPPSGGIDLTPPPPQ